MHGPPQPAAGQAGRWRAPAATGPVRATVTVPGSKSMTNRALILAALADGPVTITGALTARDTHLMAAALRALGTQICAPARTAPTPSGHASAPGGHAPASASTPGDHPSAPSGHASPPASTPGDHPSAPSGHASPPASTPGDHPSAPSDDAFAPGAWRVTPGRAGRQITIDVGNAGTVMRFVPPVAALTGAETEFRGDERASERPLRPLLAALRAFGVAINDGDRGSVPFLVLGRGGVPGGRVTLDASGSSQFVSGLLLAAPRYDKGAEIRHQGPRIPSQPHIDMTVQMLRDAGAQVETGSRNGNPAGISVPDLWRVYPGSLHPAAIAIQPDLSAAAPFLAAALVTGGSVTVRDWPARTTQPAGQILDVLASMGAAASMTGDGLRLTGTGRIGGVTANLGDIGELVPVLTALAALADSPSVFTGVGHLRRHESDRLAALAAEIGGLGGDVTERADGLEIRPRPLRAAGTVFDSHDDHRLVMAAAVLGLAVPGLTVGNAATVGKTFPAFTGAWSAMLEQSP
jgi:3-phosphoshikimate 1-carboxyvinyltransferase